MPRRTILSADIVSFLAAAILYFFAAGDVRGFAFTLGLSTLLDIVVVFLFTHPLVSTYLSKFPAFRVEALHRALDAVRGGPAISDPVLPAPGGRRAVGKPAASSTSVAVLEPEDEPTSRGRSRGRRGSCSCAAARIVLNKADIEKTASAAAADDCAVDDIEEVEMTLPTRG